MAPRKTVRTVVFMVGSVVFSLALLLFNVLVVMAAGAATPASQGGIAPAVYELTGHTAGVTALAFSPRGRLLVSSGDDQTIRLWDLSTGRELRVLRGHTGSVHTLSVSANGQLVVSGSADTTIRIWDTSSGKELKTLIGRFGAIRGVAFSPDAQQVASVGDDGSLRIWDWAAGKESKAMRSRFGSIFSVAFSPDGLTLATGGGDALAHLWDLATLRERRAFSRHGGAVYTVAFSADGALLGTGAADGMVHLWDLVTGQERTAFSGHRGAVRALDLAPDGRTIASAGTDGTVRFWDVTTGSERAMLTDHTGPVLAVAFSPDGSLVASGGQDRLIRVRSFAASPVGAVPVPPPAGPAVVGPGKPPPEVRPPQPPIAELPHGMRPQQPPAAEPPAAPKGVVPAPPLSGATSAPGAASGIPPVIALASPAEGQQVTSERIPLIGAAASDKGIARIEIRINGQLLAQREPPAGGRASNLDFSERLPLRDGKNDIVVTAFDSQSLATSRTISVHKVEVQNKLWAVVIGISRYKAVPPLQSGDKDALAVYDYLLKQVGIPKEHITLLTNDQATLVNVRRTLGTELKRKAGLGDTVIIYYAGHGAPETDATSQDEDGLEKYLVLYDADPEDLYTTGMPMREIEVIFQRLASERVIFIADTCFSGAAIGRTFATAARRAMVSDTFLARLSRGKGRVVLTASRANEVSEERNDLGHGVFTYYLLEGLKGKADQDVDGVITVDEVYNYVSQKVPEATGQNQHPLKKGEVEGQLVLGRVR
jgi:hypothetical protein